MLVNGFSICFQNIFRDIFNMLANMLTIIGAGKWPGLLSPAQSFSKATAAQRKIAASMFGEKNTWTSFHVFIFHLKNSQIFFPYDRGRKYHFHNWVYLYSKACQSCRICMDCGSNIIECGHIFVFFSISLFCLCLSLFCPCFCIHCSAENIRVQSCWVQA